MAVSTTGCRAANSGPCAGWASVGSAADLSEVSLSIAGGLTIQRPTLGWECGENDVYPRLILRDGEDRGGTGNGGCDGAEKVCIELHVITG